MSSSIKSYSFPAEPHAPLAAGHLERPRVQPQIPEGNGVAAGLTVAPPQQQPHAGQQLLRLKGLGQIVIRPAVQAPAPGRSTPPRAVSISTGRRCAPPAAASAAG